MTAEVDTIERAYQRFNARDIDGVIALLHAEVVWANGMVGGHVHGHDGVRRYWTRQWATIDPKVEPLGFSAGPGGEIVVEVHQITRDLAGKLLSDNIVGHIFRVEGELIRRFDIRGVQ